VKKRLSLLQSDSDDVRDASSGREHEPSPPPAPKPKKSRAKKPVALPAVKKDKPAKSQAQLSNLPPARDEREELGSQVTFLKPAEKNISPASRKEKATQAKVLMGTIPSQGKTLKTLAEHTDTVAPIKTKKKVNLGGGRGLLGGFGGLGRIGASSINWGEEIGGSNMYGTPLTLSSPIKGGRDEATKPPQGSMFTFGVNN